MTGLKRSFVLFVVMSFSGMAAAQQRATVAPYTAQQAAAGRTLYQANCAGCHLADLRGSWSIQILPTG